MGVDLRFETRCSSRLMGVYGGGSRTYLICPNLDHISFSPTLLAVISLNHQEGLSSLFSSLAVFSMYVSHKFSCSILLAYYSEFPDQLKPCSLPQLLHFPAYTDWWVLLSHSHIPLPETEWISSLPLPHLALHSRGWVVPRAVCVLTVHIQCIQAWGCRPFFGSAVRFWCRACRRCQHGGQSSTKSYASGLLTLSDHIRRCYFQVHCINLYFYLM